MLTFYMAIPLTAGRTGGAFERSHCYQYDKVDRVLQTVSLYQTLSNHSRRVRTLPELHRQKMILGMHVYLHILEPPTQYQQHRPTS